MSHFRRGSKMTTQNRTFWGRGPKITPKIGHHLCTIPKMKRGNLPFEDILGFEALHAPAP